MSRPHTDTIALPPTPTRPDPMTEFRGEFNMDYGQLLPRMNGFSNRSYAEESGGVTLVGHEQRAGGIPMVTLPGRDASLEELVVTAAAGDAGSWYRLVDRFLPLVWSVVRSYRLSQSDGEDVSQIVWLRLVEHLGRIEQPLALPGWISVTARNECLNLLRTRRRRTMVDVDGVEGTAAFAVEPSFDENLMRSELHTALLSAFATLPDAQRDILTVLIEDPPPDYQQISQRLGIPIGSIGPTRQRALSNLRKSASLVPFSDYGGEQ